MSFLIWLEYARKGQSQCIDISHIKNHIIYQIRQISSEEHLVIAFISFF